MAVHLNEVLCYFRKRDFFMITHKLWGGNAEPGSQKPCAIDSRSPSRLLRRADLWWPACARDVGASACDQQWLIRIRHLPRKIKRESDQVLERRSNTDHLPRRVIVVALDEAQDAGSAG